MAAMKPTRTPFRTIVTAAFVVAAGHVAGCGNGSAPAPPTATDAKAEPAENTAPAPSTPAAAPGMPAEPSPRHDEFVRARDRAVRWLDKLDMDLEALERNDIESVKKLSELLWAYQILHRHRDDPDARAAYRARAVQLAALTNTLDFHALDSYDDDAFDAAILPYMLVAVLLEYFDIDTRYFRQALGQLKPRLDRSLSRRGSTQRAAFVDLYDKLGLQKPPGILDPRVRAQSMLAQRPPADTITVVTGYKLVHEVYAAFDYGERRVPTRLGPDDIAYLKSVLPALIDECIRQSYPDLMAEALSAMIYLGEGRHPAAVRALDWLLEHQNPDGRWGDYEILRMTYGSYVDHQMYLHTVQVTLRALCDAFVGNWPSSPAFAPTDG
jgi:hypothetical protein